MQKNKAVKIFVILSIATIFIKKWEMMGGLLKISDIFFVIGFLLLIIDILRGKISINGALKRKILLSATITIPLLTGTLATILIFGNLPFRDIFISYLKIVVCLFNFISVIILSKDDQKFPAIILLSLLFSLIVIPIAYTFPSLVQNGFLLDNSNYRFAGLFNDPNYFSNFMIVPIVILISLFIKNYRNVLLSIILFISISLSFGFFSWSGSRSGWLGLAVSIISLAIFQIVKFGKKNGLKRAVMLSLVIVFALFIGIKVVPKTGAQSITNRISSFVYVEHKDNIVPSTTLSPNYNDNQPVPKLTTVHFDLLSGQSRGKVWEQAFTNIFINPAGYGPGYNTIIDMKEPGGSHSVSHNIILEIFLMGGVPLFILLFIFLKKIFWDNREKIIEQYIIFSAILGTLVSALFLDSFESRWIWIIIAIYISLKSLPKILDSSSVNSVS